MRKMKMTAKTWRIFAKDVLIWFFKLQLPVMFVVVWFLAYLNGKEMMDYRMWFVGLSAVCLAFNSILAWEDTHPKDPCMPTGYCRCGAECVCRDGGNCDEPAEFTQRQQELGYQAASV